MEEPSSKDVELSAKMVLLHLTGRLLAVCMYVRTYICTYLPMCISMYVSMYVEGGMCRCPGKPESSEPQELELQDPISQWNSLQEQYWPLS